MAAARPRAAVAREAGKPPSIATIEIEGPRDGEALVGIEATGICHTDACTLSGADPEGLFPAIPGRRRHLPRCGTGAVLPLLAQGRLNGVRRGGGWTTPCSNSSTG